MLSWASSDTEPAAAAGRSSGSILLGTFSHGIGSVMRWLLVTNVPKTISTEAIVNATYCGDLVSGQVEFGDARSLLSL